MRQALRRNPARRRIASTAAMPAPVGGWDTSEPLARMSPDRARVLLNWFPQPDAVELRRGYALRADTGAADPVETLMPYHGVTVSTLFAAAGGTIVNVDDPLVPLLSGLGTARWQHINFATSGGTFLWACNGLDDPQVFDGTSWAAAPTITGVTPSDAIYAEAYKGRIWFVLRDSSIAGYLAPDSIGGAAETLDLGGEFTLGGTLVAIANWTLDGGEGPDDYLVFISSRGQVVVYAGTDPANPTDFRKVGTYAMGAPLGRRCVTKLGGDIALICVDGVIPLSRALITDRAASRSVTLTSRIQKVMNESARRYGALFGWQMISYPRGTRGVLNVPLSENGASEQYVMNTLTGAWCRFTGMNAACWAVFQDRLYFGGTDGKIYEADVDGPDENADMRADLATSFQQFGGRGTLARYTLAQPLITSEAVSGVQIGVDTDYQNNAEMVGLLEPDFVASIWGEAIWGEDVWSSPAPPQTDWISVSGMGQNAGIRLQCVVAKQPEGEEGRVSHYLRLNGVNVAYERGGIL